jgi:hypothetical protein
VALSDLAPADMTDYGMWVWAGIFTAIGLVGSYFIAIAWQRWKDRAKAERR